MRFWMTAYDSDSESVSSERLAPAKLRLTPPPSPKPEVTRRSSTASTTSSQRSAASGESKGSPPTSKEKVKKKRKRIKTNHHPGDATFFRHFAPNNPELLPTHSYSRSFDLGPPSEDETGDSDSPMADGAVKVSYPESVLSSTQPGSPSRDGIFGHRSSLSLGHYDHYSYDPSRHSFRAHSNTRPIGVDTRYGSRSYEDYDTQKIFTKDSPVLPLNGRDSNSSFPDSAAVDGLLKLKGLPLRRASTSSETVATSPTLIPHLISPSHAAPDQTLAAMAPDSPNGVAPPPAPKQEVSLPPFSEVIGISNRQRASSYSNSGSPLATSPQDGLRTLPHPIYNPGQGGAPLTRTSTVSSHDANSPSRHSPDLMPSPVNGTHHPHPQQHHHHHSHHYHHQQQQPRRVGYRQGPIPSLPTYDPGSSNSSRSYSNSAGTSTGTSSGNEGLTPISSNNTSSERSMMYDSRPEANTDHLSAKYVHYPSVPVAGGYKCQFEGCDAPPFTTQYLLNSHANVHSSERPHFCQIKGCPRGEGGMGFKRKNEMIRHGLVHQSPGYLCPWCDREHRYPRPDNLQRHVSTHHKDKSRDDPKLLEVLAQRAPGGVTRGRRRRA